MVVQGSYQASGVAGVTKRGKKDALNGRFGHGKQETIRLPFNASLSP